MVVETPHFSCTWGLMMPSSSGANSALAVLREPSPTFCLMNPNYHQGLILNLPLLSLSEFLDHDYNHTLISYQGF